MCALDAVLDHVAIAVPDAALAQQRWRDELSGGLVSTGQNDVFATRQLRYANGGKLELLSAVSAERDNFVRRFLERFGAQVHHVTLKVPDLQAALALLRDAGLHVVDVQDTDDIWREAFLRPSQVGGLVVQVAWAGLSEQEWARRGGTVPEPAGEGAPALLGPTLTHPDLPAAEQVWRVLGAAVEPDGNALICSWPDSPLTVRLERGPDAAAVGLRLRDAEGREIEERPPLA